MSEQPSGELILYQREDGTPSIEVRFAAETVWLSQQQIAHLFQTTRENITMHLRNVFDEGELELAATSKDFLQVRDEGSRTVRRKVTHYNLDAIISVGYRVKGNVATQFRVWATGVLREYLVAGVAINQRRLAELESVVQILSRSTDELVAGVADVVGRYLPGLQTLRDYDAGSITPPRGSTPIWTLTYEEARAVVDQVRAEFPEDTLFGGERGGAFRGVVETIYQGFVGQEIYPTVEAKAANLLYLVVKDHPLSDGNKRSAAALFVHFLARNNALLGTDGVPRISNNALAAITLMVAMSDPKEKDLMVALLMSMLAGEAS